MRAFIGGVALFAPLDSELEFDWLHGLDIKMAGLCRQALRLGISARAPLYIPARYAGYAQPSAVRDFAIIPWCRELLVELNDPGSWGRVTRGLWDSLLAPAIARGRRPLAPAKQGVHPDGPPALAAAPPGRDSDRVLQTHVGRLVRKLAGYGIFIRDLHHKTHSRLMDLLAEELLSRAANLLPAEPALWWAANRRAHAAWSAFAMGSAVDLCLPGWEAI